jgi:hypothetical protein
MTKEQIIQSLIDKYGYKSYLEIGTQKGVTFNGVQCETKVGVDPDDRGIKGVLVGTSDDFFKHSTMKFDIIFIDALHHADQVEKDIVNSLKFLNEGGIVVVHDMLPTDEPMQKVPREVKEWTGDGWKAFASIKAVSPDLEMQTVDTDYGCGLIRSGKGKKIMISKNLTWEYFVKSRDRIMGVISVEEFENQYLSEE